MSEFDNALQEIIEILARGDETEASNWTAIMDELVGSTDAETINNVYKPSTTSFLLIISTIWNVQTSARFCPATTP